MIRLWYNCVSLEENDRLDAHLPPLDPAQLLAFLSKTETGFCREQSCYFKSAIC